MTTKEQRLHEWIARIADYMNSGLTMSAWCTANHFTKEKLRYWLRKTKAASSTAALTPPTHWVPLAVADQTESPNSAPSLVVCVGQASIELRIGFDAQLLREIVQALEALC
ncbi:IS66 family insertion sequence element accessory protein TnpA [Paenibacillus sp. MMS18-CY102]|uniref:IS66 family insertion sequence element accessory protein TnpA n=1 Tax=Paenibacillus sp. MMS18-CY102 TaxID=2682849 RepID=UPI0013662919|nr:IS66 family insertion sequence element accessory protein TnpB [Paenibacillus sp. MMS18-CY102]MWC29881.1 IS66 family insertion sequence element accessory protein TnpB [Paenibacillus sp. MMS18-CY102]